jgi:TadE-like protein
MLLPRLLRRTADRQRRGQAMVEFAIILPFLVLLLVMAVDAGRLFFGYVALHNASRIGADHAASHPDAWNGVPDPIEQGHRDRYAALITADLHALGCQGSPVPDPVFTGFTDGDSVNVELECDFSPLTPLVESFMGQPLSLRASSDFAVNRTISAGLPPPGAPPPPPSGGPTPSPGSCVAPNFVGPPAVRKNNAQALWTAAGFTTPLVFVPNNGNYFIVDQAPLNGGQSGPCSTVERVSNAVIP